MATGLYYSDACLLHDTGGHPESRHRLEAITKRLAGVSALTSLSRREARAADLSLVKAVHLPPYVDRVVRMAESGGGYLDPDTLVSPGTIEAALHAAGGAVEASVATVRGEIENAFVAVRPCGHHATAGQGMGFCLFNNVAIAARLLLSDGLARRVAILDFDVHHGNGTQAIFEEDPSVLFISVHQSPLYPGSGHYREIGRGEGEGYTVNVPLPPLTGDEGYDRVMELVAKPAVERFAPDILLVSAGYDPHWQDPLSNMALTVSGFRRMMARIKVLSSHVCGGKMVAVLEGGYDLKALAAAAEASIRVLAGSDVEVKDPHGCPSAVVGMERVEAVIAAVRAIHDLA